MDELNVLCVLCSSVSHWEKLQSTCIMISQSRLDLKCLRQSRILIGMSEMKRVRSHQLFTKNPNAIHLAVAYSWILFDGEHWTLYTPKLFSFAAKSIRWIGFSFEIGNTTHYESTQQMLSAEIDLVELKPTTFLQGTHHVCLYISKTALSSFDNRVIPACI